MARAVYCEAAGYLSAIRTALDIIVYVAARRAGVDVVAAERWEATKAIAPNQTAGTPSIKYDVDDIIALRGHRDWFETLNLYRNAMLHRGWHEQSFGYFDRGDSAPEATDPVHNVMLVPDLQPLKQGARPDKWTYSDRKWLDALLGQLGSGTELALGDLFRVWDLPDPAAGEIPLEDHPTVFLTVPCVPPIEGQSPPALHVFLSKQAARMFLDHFRKNNLALEGCTFRAIRRTTLHGEGVGYLIAYDAGTLGSVAELHFMEVSNGSVGVVETHRFNPSERNGPSNQILWFRLPTVDRDPLYVLAYTGT